MNTEMSPAALAAIEKVQKLLALANDTRGNENEAQSALDLAHRILEQHNLDVASVEAHNKAPGAKRDDAKSAGGLYKWQRKVWEETAKLNMCMYFSIKGLEAGSKYEQRFIGRPENVLMTRLMGDYLQTTIERMAAEWAKDQGYQSRFVRDAIIYREGMADRICDRLSSMRWERVQESRRQEEAARAARQPGEPGTGLVLASVVQSEDDLNQDYLRGWEPGTTARRRAESEARYKAIVARNEQEAKDRAARRLIDPTFDLECKAEEAAKAKADAAWEKKWNRRHSRGYSTRETAEDRRRAHPAHYAGRAAGDKVSLDRQIDGDAKPRIK